METGRVVKPASETWGPPTCVPNPGCPAVISIELESNGGEIQRIERKLKNKIQGDSLCDVEVKEFTVCCLSKRRLTGAWLRYAGTKE